MVLGKRTQFNTVLTHLTYYVNYIDLFRLKLPTTQIDKSQVSVWDMVKHFIGKV